MGNYNPPVAGLLKLGEVRYGGAWADYTAFGIGPEHIPELIRLVRDKELADSTGEAPEVYAQVHAWRALAQLRAEPAIEPLLDLLAARDVDDWVADEVPGVLGMIGPAALAPTATRLADVGRERRTTDLYAQSLTEIAKRHPETRAEVVDRLRACLHHALGNDASTNGFVIANLLDLEAIEAWPTIEAAFATGNVDESIAGDAARVKYELGLGPEPPPRQYSWRPSGPTGTNAKQRFNERQRRKKLEKKERKKQKGK